MCRRHVAGSRGLDLAAGLLQLSEHTPTSYGGGIILGCIRMVGLEG